MVFLPVFSDKLTDCCEEDVDGAIEQAVTDQNSKGEEHLPMPSLLPAVGDPTLSTSVVESLMISQLAIGSSEPSDTPFSQSWQTSSKDPSHGSIPLENVNPQDVQRFSPALSSPLFMGTPRETTEACWAELPQGSQAFSPAICSRMFLDTPRETTRIPSADFFNGNIDLSFSDDTASFEPSRDQDTATGNAVSPESEQINNPVQQSCAKKRKAPKIGQSSKRVKRQQGQDSRRESEPFQVESYIQMEKEKCVALGFPYHKQNYLPRSVTEFISGLTKENERVAVSMISTAIGSSESIALLQHIVVSSRVKGPQTKPVENLAITDRLQVIHRLSSQIGEIELLRRCHVWTLYKDISRELFNPEGQFVIVGPKSISSPMRGKSGNPNYIRDSEITKAILRALAPGLEKGNRGYKKEYEYSKKLRKLGQRLQLLTQFFGFGVLGLIPSQDFLESVEFDVRIRDETCVPLPCSVTR
jgi:hypothetical protein